MAPSTAGDRIATRLLPLVYLDRDARPGGRLLGPRRRRRVDGHAAGMESVLQDERRGDDRAAVEGQIVERRPRPGQAGHERIEAGAPRGGERGGGGGPPAGGGGGARPGPPPPPPPGPAGAASAPTACPGPPPRAPPTG